MRHVQRIVLLVALVAVAPVLVGCESFDNDKFNIFGLNDKKKLKGERKELFPEGVPGVTQGLPPEYLKNQQQQQLPDTAQSPAAVPANPAAGAPIDIGGAPAQPSKTAAVEPVQEPKPKAKPKRKPKPRTAARPATQATAPPAAQRPNGGQQQPAPWPDRDQTQSPAQGQSTAPWPSAPPRGNFSR